MASSSTTEQTFIGPGLSPFKLIVTILGVIGVTALVLWIAVYEGTPVIASTIIAILFILGFVIYLRIVVPIPFTIELQPEALVKRNRQGEIIEIPWENLTRVKEEFFPNGKRISVSVFRKVTEPGQKAKAWAVYRDDVPNIDALAEALQAAIPSTCQWEKETVTND